MPESLRRALEEALDHEHLAEATYQAAIAAFGPIPPFVEIVEAERRHADALLCLFERHGFDVPPNRWRGTVDKPADLPAACHRAACTEQAGAALYERLLRDVTEPDVRVVFRQLLEESRCDHMPAFETCAEDRTRHLRPA
jgi:hypothetical protein